ncbi:MAG: hypothetical protein HY696_03480 [Deltaproteobacteria bacterium]|nr:hypothetical protein [Deltaproteobacteria bacterium]
MERHRRRRWGLGAIGFQLGLWSVLVIGWAVPTAGASNDALPCSPVPITSVADVLNPSANGLAKVMKPLKAMYRVGTSHYALCFAPTVTVTHPVVLMNPTSLPLLIDGLNITLPATADPTLPALTLSGTAPIIVRNSTITRDGAPVADTTGIAVTGATHTLYQTKVLNFATGVAVSGTTHTLHQLTITGPASGGGLAASALGGGLLPDPIGLQLTGPGHQVSDAAIAQVATGIQLTPPPATPDAPPLSLTGGTITDAQVGVHILAPPTGETAALPIDTATPPMTLLPGKFIKVPTPFQSDQPLPTDLAKQLLIAKKCAKTVPLDGYEICDPNWEGNTITMLEGAMPNSYCDLTSPNILQVLLYENTADTTDSTNQIDLMAQCTTLALVEPKVFVMSNASVTNIPAGACVFRCEKDLNGKPLQLLQASTIRPAGIYHAALGFITDSEWLLAQVADESLPKITTAITPATATLGESGALLPGPSDGGAAGGEADTGATVVGESGSTIVAMNAGDGAAAGDTGPAVVGESGAAVGEASTGATLLGDSGSTIVAMNDGDGTGAVPWNAPINDTPVGGGSGPAPPESPPAGSQETKPAAVAMAGPDTEGAAVGGFGSGMAAATGCAFMPQTTSTGPGAVVSLGGVLMVLLVAKLSWPRLAPGRPLRRSRAKA